MRNIMILAAAIMIGCGDKDEEDTGSDDGTNATDDSGDSGEDTGPGDTGSAE